MNLQKYIEKYKKIHDGSGTYLHEVDGKVTKVRGRVKKNTPFTGFHVYTNFGPFLKYYINNVLKHAATILDYGSGAGHHLYRTSQGSAEESFNSTRKDFYEYMNGCIQCYWCYDPSYQPFERKPPEISFDIVVCCDVMEHIPEDSVDYVLDDIKKYTDEKTLVVFSISGQKAQRTFEDGENLHCTVKPISYWTEKVEERWTNFVLMHESDRKVIVENYVQSASK